MNVSDEKLLYRIGVSLIPGIGCILAKRLIAYVGSVEGIFSEKKRKLVKIPGIGDNLAQSILESKVLKTAEEEIKFIRKYNIVSCFYLDDDYPERLKHCNDSPIILYIKGEPAWKASKAVSIVGTRSATREGKEATAKLVKEMTERGHAPVIISGLAFGIDISAHKAALDNGLKTIAVFGHGLDKIYPIQHREIAKKIAGQGALITEFTTSAPFEKQNFLRRNRIIAGLADATIVVESGIKGGALVTADIAMSYNRDVFAVPGRINDRYSAGCNRLIKTNKAALIENVSDIEYQLGWNIKPQKPEPKQKELFVTLSENDKSVLKIIQESEKITIDLISQKATIPVGMVSFILLNLEFAGLIKSLPGKVYIPV
ncbi:MAG: DNA-protecting protein DprA [Bacteroidia bacterium]|nr:DNA-protecting protein DprA [Bacteroidia bacterium]